MVVVVVRIGGEAGPRLFTVTGCEVMLASTACIVRSFPSRAGMGWAVHGGLAWLCRD